MNEQLDPLEAARRHEEEIRDQAERLWRDAWTSQYGEDHEPQGWVSVDLSPAIFDALYPLLRRPIPAGYIIFTPQVTGKPYESTGVRSVQVLIDRMNNVLGPRHWWDEVTYSDDGKLCHVRICVGTRPGPQVVRDERVTVEHIIAVGQSWGGVDRGSTKGNVYKGSYTNAAKRAFAALGPGHEVYLGDADLDPDVNADVATAPADDKPPAGIGNAAAKKIVDAAWETPDAKANLQLAAAHAAKGEVGDCSTKAKATKALAGLSHAAAERLEQWIVKKGEPS